MRKRNMRGYVAALALTAGLCMTQGLSVQAATDVQGDSGSDQEYEAADPSKGVTYVKNDAGSTMVILLLFANLTNQHHRVHISIFIMIKTGMESWMKVNQHLNWMEVLIFCILGCLFTDYMNRSQIGHLRSH